MDSPWQVYTSSNGHVYYYNTTTQQTTWEKPDCLKTAHELAKEQESSGPTEQEEAEDAGYDPWEDDQYFTSYADLKLQEEMLQDEPRAEAYLNAMMQHPHDFQDKVVLDVGCGTGLLSFFAIKAGAKKVYAIEASGLAVWTRMVVASNNLLDKIHIINSKMEDAELPEMVDVIVSEWMGSLLIFESMFDSVLYARDKWLKKGGCLYPSAADMYIAAYEDNQLWDSKIERWSNVCGINMSAMRPLAIKNYFERSLFTHAAPKDSVLSSSVTLLAHLDLNTITLPELDRITKGFSWRAARKGRLHGVVCWFDVHFDGSTPSDSKRVTLSTCPSAPTTHWKQELFIMNQYAEVEEGDVIEGEIDIIKNAYWRRHYNIDLTVRWPSGQFVKSFARWREKHRSTVAAQKDEEDAQKFADAEDDNNHNYNVEQEQSA